VDDLDSFEDDGLVDGVQRELDPVKVVALDEACGVMPMSCRKWVCAGQQGCCMDAHPYSLLFVLEIMYGDAACEVFVARPGHPPRQQDVAC